jgi:hypothetical protein
MSERPGGAHYCNFHARERGASCLFFPGEPRHSREPHKGTSNRITAAVQDYRGVSSNVRGVTTQNTVTSSRERLRSVAIRLRWYTSVAINIGEEVSDEKIVLCYCDVVSRSGDG